MSTTNDRIDSSPTAQLTQAILIRIPIGPMTTSQDRAIKTSTLMKLIHPHSNHYNIPQSCINNPHSSNINTLPLDINLHPLIHLILSTKNSIPQWIPTLMKDSKSNITTDQVVPMRSLMIIVLSATKWRTQ